MRTALVSLDAAPAWFVRSQAGDHLTAQQARQYAATDGECTAMLYMMQSNALRTHTDYRCRPVNGHPSGRCTLHSALAPCAIACSARYGAVQLSASPLHTWHSTCRQSHAAGAAPLPRRTSKMNL